MAGRRPGGAFGGGWGNGVNGFPWAGGAPAISAQPQPASPPPVTPPATSVASLSAKPLPPAQSTTLSSSRPPASVPSAGGTSSVSSKPSGTSRTSTQIDVLKSEAQTSEAANAHGTGDGSASISISFTSLDGQTIQVGTTVTTSSQDSHTPVTANTQQHSSKQSGIVAVATISALLLTVLVVALGIFLLRRRRRRARAIRSSFIHVSAASNSNSDVARTTRTFSKEAQISRPMQASNRASNVLDEENARLREAVARLQDRLEDLGHADDPSLPAYDSHSAASHDSHA